MLKLKEELRAKGFPETDEMAVLHAMFPQELEKFLKPAAPAAASIAPTPVAPAAPSPAAASSVHSIQSHYSLRVEGRAYSVEVEDLGDR